MDADTFEAAQRAREYFHALTVLPGAWTVIRLDGRGFSRFTEQRFDKPFDARFSDLMVTTAQTVLTELGGRYAYTESDEISVLFDPSHDLFGRGVEKLVSISAGIATAAFTHAASEPAHFDSRLWVGVGIPDVVDYFSWRQADAARCALNGWCYWTLRKAGQSRQQATAALERASTADKNELLFRHDINFNDLPTWQRRGIGLWWETYQRPGYNPIRQTEVTATRRRITVDRDLPMKAAYRERLARTVELLTRHPYGLVHTSDATFAHTSTAPRARSRGWSWQCCCQPTSIRRSRGLRRSRSGSQPMSARRPDDTLRTTLVTDAGPVVVDVKPRHRLDRPEVARTFAWTREVVRERGGGSTCGANRRGQA